MPAIAGNCKACGEKDLVWTFVWEGVAYQSKDHSKISSTRRTLNANTARLARRPKMDNAQQV